ncbi:MAG: hypothetical protein HZA50_12125 [Planctomycetes bacterium]|nr:hypothetical protein [Planctomycetota bacterium]
MRKVKYILAGMIVASLPACHAGCGADSVFMDPERQAEGLVIILPGIEGESGYNHEIRNGLLSAGVTRAMTIYRWGRPIPVLGSIMNQVDFIGNYIAGAGIARMIVEYQDKYPGRPVCLIGHSGGGGVAVFAAQQLPEGRRIDGVILLSASISAGYDLTKALQRCRLGIVNFFNRSDIGLLGVATTIMGNVDGGHGPSAGLIGFDQPPANADAVRSDLYSRKLYQVEMTPNMTFGDSDSHGAATRSYFVAGYVADWVTEKTWPPAGATSVSR